MHGNAEYRNHFISQRFDYFKVIIRSGLNYMLAAKYIMITVFI